MNGANTLDMSLLDYTGTLHHWAKAHSSQEQETVELAPGEYDEMLAMAGDINWDELKPVTGGDDGNS